MDGTDVTEVLTGVTVCGTEVRGNRTDWTVVASEQELSVTDRTEVQNGGGAGVTEKGGVGVLGQWLYLRKKLMGLMLQTF